MQATVFHVIGLFRSRLAGTLVLALLIATSWHASAQAQVAAMVNGDPITVLDVTQRMRLTEISTHKAQSRDTDVVVCASGNLALIYFTDQPGRLSLEYLVATYPGLASFAEAVLA